MALTHVSRLAFGRAIPNGGEVTDDDWNDFQAGPVAAMFPDGFTVLPASGGWRDATTGLTITEPSIILEVAHDGSTDAIAAIRMVATVYKTLFRQDAVMVTTVPASVDFI